MAVGVQVLAVIPDQDTFYDLVDSLEDQGLERITDRISKSRGVRADIVDDFRTYESALRREDNTDHQLDLIENARYCVLMYRHTGSYRRVGVQSTGNHVLNVCCLSPYVYFWLWTRIFRATTVMDWNLAFAVRPIVMSVVPRTLLHRHGRLIDWHWCYVPIDTK